MSLSLGVVCGRAMCRDWAVIVRGRVDVNVIVLWRGVVGNVIVLWRGVVGKVIVPVEPCRC